MVLRRTSLVWNEFKQFQTLHYHVVIPTLIFLTVLTPHALAVKIGVMHYGSYTRMGITCQRDELILISSEVLGYSTDPECNPRPMCSVPYTLAKWYCRGKSTCSGIPVERRPLHKRTCGSDFTNCLRVEYQCVQRQNLLNVCEDREVESSHQGFLTSPSFPNMYLPDQNCTCYIQSNEGTPVQLKSVFFLLKANQPCRDYVGVKTDKKYWGKTCGYNSKENIFRGQTIQLDFISDKNSQEMGFWMEYKGAGPSGVSIKCGQKADLLNQQKGRQGMTTVLDLYKWHKKRMKQKHAKQGLQRRTGKKVYLRNGKQGPLPTQVVSFGDKQENKYNDDLDEYLTTTKPIFIQDMKPLSNNNNNKYIKRNFKQPIINDNKPQNFDAFVPGQNTEEQDNFQETKSFTEGRKGESINRLSSGVITIQDKYKEASPEDNKFLSHIKQQKSHLEDRIEKENRLNTIKIFSKEGTEGVDTYGFRSSANRKDGFVKQFRKYVPMKETSNTKASSSQGQNRDKIRYRIYDPKTGKFGWKLGPRKYRGAIHSNSKHVQKYKLGNTADRQNTEDFKNTIPELSGSNKIKESKNSLSAKTSNGKLSTPLIQENTSNSTRTNSIVQQQHQPSDKMNTENNVTSNSSSILTLNTDIKNATKNQEEDAHKQNVLDNRNETNTEDFRMDDRHMLQPKEKNQQTSTQQIKLLSLDSTTPASLLKKSQNLIKSAEEPILENSNKEKQRSLNHTYIIDDKSEHSDHPPQANTSSTHKHIQDVSEIDHLLNASEFVTTSTQQYHDLNYKSTVKELHLVTMNESSSTKPNEVVVKQYEELSPDVSTKDVTADDYNFSSDIIDGEYDIYSDHNDKEFVSNDVEEFTDVHTSLETEHFTTTVLISEKTTPTTMIRPHIATEDDKLSSPQKDKTNLEDDKIIQNHEFSHYRTDASNNERKNTKQKVIEIIHMGNVHAILDDLPTAVITEKPTHTKALKGTDKTNPSSVLVQQFKEDDNTGNMTNNYTKNNSNYQLPNLKPTLKTSEIINQSNHIPADLDKTKMTTLPHTLPDVVKQKNTKNSIRQEDQPPAKPAGNMANDTKTEQYDANYLVHDQSYYLSTEGMLSSSTHNSDKFKDVVQHDAKENRYKGYSSLQDNSTKTKEWNTNDVLNSKFKQDAKTLMIHNRFDFDGTLANSKDFATVLNAPNNSVLYKYFNKPHKTWQERYNTWASYYYNLYKFNHERQNNLTNEIRTLSMTATLVPISNSTRNVSIESHSSKKREHLSATTISSQLKTPEDIKTAMPETTTPYVSQIQKQSTKQKQNSSGRNKEQKMPGILTQNPTINNRTGVASNKQNQTVFTSTSQKSMSTAEKLGSDNILGNKIKETGSLANLLQNAFKNTKRRIESQSDRNKQGINTTSRQLIEDSLDRVPAYNQKETPVNTIIVDIAQNKQFSEIIKAMETEKNNHTTTSMMSSTPDVGYGFTNTEDVGLVSTTPSINTLVAHDYKLNDEYTEREVNNVTSLVNDSSTLKSTANNLNDSNLNGSTKNMSTNTNSTDYVFINHSQILSNTDDMVMYNHNVEIGKGQSVESYNNNQTSLTDNRIVDDINDTNVLIKLGSIKENSTDQGRSSTLPSTSLNKTNTIVDVTFEQLTDTLENNRVDEKQGLDEVSLFINDAGNDSSTETIYILTASTTEPTSEDLSEIVTRKPVETNNRQDIDGKTDKLLKNTDQHLTNGNEYDHQHWWNQYWQQKWQETWEKYHRKHNLQENSTQMNPLQNVWEPSPEEFLKQDFDYQKPIIPPYLGQKDPDNIEVGTKDEQIERWNKVYGKWFLLDSKRPIEDFVKVINEKWQDKQKSFNTNQVKPDEFHSLKTDQITGDAADAFDYLVSQTGQIDDYYKWGVNPMYDYQGPLSYDNYLQHSDYSNERGDNPTFDRHYNNIFGQLKETEFLPRRAHNPVDTQQENLLSQNIGDTVTVWDARFAQNENPIQINDPELFLPNGMDTSRADKNILKISENEDFNFNVLYPKDGFSTTKQISQGNHFHGKEGLGIKNKESKQPWDIRINQPTGRNASISSKNYYKEPWDGRSFIWQGPQSSQLSYENQPVNSNMLEISNLETDLFDNTEIENYENIMSHDKLSENHIVQTNKGSDNRNLVPLKTDNIKLDNMKTHKEHTPWDIRLSKETNTALLESIGVSVKHDATKDTVAESKMNSAPYHYNILQDDENVQQTKTIHINNHIPKSHDATPIQHGMAIENHHNEVDMLNQRNQDDLAAAKLTDYKSESTPRDIRLNQAQHSEENIAIPDEITLERQDGNLYKHIDEPTETSVSDQHLFQTNNDFHDMKDWTTFGKSNYINDQFKTQTESDGNDWETNQNWNHEPREAYNDHYLTNRENSIHEIGDFGKRNGEDSALSKSVSKERYKKPLAMYNTYHTNTDNANSELSNFEENHYVNFPHTSNSNIKPIKKDALKTREKYANLNEIQSEKEKSSDTEYNIQDFYPSNNPDHKIQPNVNRAGFKQKKISGRKKSYRNVNPKKTLHELTDKGEFQRELLTNHKQDVRNDIKSTVTNQRLLEEHHKMYHPNKNWYEQDAWQQRHPTAPDNESGRLREKMRDDKSLNSDKKHNHIIPSRENQQLTNGFKNSKEPFPRLPKEKTTVKAKYDPLVDDENPSSWPHRSPFHDQSTEESNWLGKPKLRKFNYLHPTGYIQPVHENGVFLKDQVPKSKDIHIQKSETMSNVARKGFHQKPKSHRQWVKDQVTLPGHRSYSSQGNPTRQNPTRQNPTRQNQMNGNAPPHKPGLQRSKEFLQRNNQQNNNYGRRVPQPTNHGHSIRNNSTHIANNAWKHAKSVRPDQIVNQIPTMGGRDPNYPYVGMLPHNMQQNLGDADPTLYGRIQNYLDHQGYNKNLLVPGSKMAAIESQPEPTKGVNKDTVWVLLVIAIIGWLIFMVMVGLLVYYKRHRMCNSKMFRSRHGYASSYGSSMPKHLLFPDLHSPLCTFSHPQADLSSSSSSAGHSPSIPTRPHSANSNESLLGIPQYNPQSDPRPRKKKNKQAGLHPLKQLNKTQRHINDETFSNHSAFSNGAMSDRPLPPVPLSPCLDQVQNRTRSSSMCAEIAFSSNSSTESIGVQEIMGHCDIPGFDSKSIVSRITPASGKSHYQSLNTIRDRKAKHRCPSPDLNYFAQMPHVEVNDPRNQQRSQIKKPTISSNVNNWVVQNMPPKGGYNVTKPKPSNIDAKPNIRPGTPVLRQKQYANEMPSTFSTFMPVEMHATPYPEPEEVITKAQSIKDNNPPYTNIQEINASVSDGCLSSGSSPIQQSQSVSDFSNANTSSEGLPSNSDTEHSVKTIPHPYAQTSTSFNEHRPSSSASVINSPMEQRQEKEQHIPVKLLSSPPTKPQRNAGSKSIRSTSTLVSNTPSECTEAIYMSLTKIANKYTDNGQNNHIFTSRFSSDTFDKNSLISQLDQVSSKNSLISQRGQTSSKQPLLREIDEVSTQSSPRETRPSPLSQMDPNFAKNSLINHIDQVTANFKPSGEATSKVHTPPLWTDLYQNGQIIKENASLMSSESSTSIEQEPSTGSTLSMNALKESSQNSSVVSRTIRSPSNDQVFLKTAPHMVNDGNPFSSNSNNEVDEFPGNIPFQSGAAAFASSSDITTSSAAVSEITLPAHTKFPEPLSPNPILMGSQALKSAASLLPMTFAEASAIYTPVSKPPSGSQTSKPHLGLPGILHARQNGKSFEDATAVTNRHIQGLTNGMHNSKVNGKQLAERSRSQINANAHRIITTLSKTKPGSSAERIKKIIPEQASVFNEKVKPELNRILSQRTARLPVHV